MCICVIRWYNLFVIIQIIIFNFSFTFTGAIHMYLLLGNGGTYIGLLVLFLHIRWRVDLVSLVLPTLEGIIVKFGQWKISSLFLSLKWTVEHSVWTAEWFDWSYSVFTWWWPTTPPKTASLRSGGWGCGLHMSTTPLCKHQILWTSLKRFGACPYPPHVLIDEDVLACEGKVIKTSLFWLIIMDYIPIWSQIIP